jgi:hypothetical protein
MKMSGTGVGDMRVMHNGGRSPSYFRSSYGVAALQKKAPNPLRSLARTQKRTPRFRGDF